MLSSKNGENPKVIYLCVLKQSGYDTQVHPFHLYVRCLDGCIWKIKDNVFVNALVHSIAYVWDDLRWWW